ncbi:MAG: DNA mismatch repair endonuclease MutL [Nitrospirota bacterium]|nr:DNA mismatch repair endonuclease MutL [Nitrospirota bacterium]
MTDAPRIRLLPDPLVDQIAAGEVVERPASVVKELLENALDAGARRITIEVEHGGKRRIRITDDGSGIHPEDLALAVTRHATSKIRQLSDLSAARTLGFRGEALPSIGSVSQLTITSTRAGAAEGASVTVSGGIGAETRPAPPTPGTTVEVRDLFYNTPARAKFLKADTTEWGHVAETVTETALGAPGVTFVLTHNGKPGRRFDAADDFAARAAQVCADEVAAQLIPVSAHDPERGMRLTGLIARPGFTRSGRDTQRLIVNGRPVKNSTIGHAVYAAYETALPGGRHPVFLLSLTLDPAQVDVNVHPTKREIRLSQGGQVHHFVRGAVRDALGGFRGNTLRLTRMASPADGLPTAPGNPSADWAERVRQAAVRSVTPPGAASPMGGTTTAREPVMPFGASMQAATGAAPTLPGMPTQTGAAFAENAPARVVGQVQRTFVLVEQGDRLRVIDQHTAHERILFERLLARLNDQGLPGQRLLVPLDVELPAADAARLAEHVDELARLGLEVEPFGGDAFLIRAVPEPLAGRDPRALLVDIVDELSARGSGAEAMQSLLHRLLATVACHAAVKAGDPLSTPQMERLIADLEQVDNPHTCPHGRAVTAVLERDTLKSLFDRNWGA